MQRSLKARPSGEWITVEFPTGLLKPDAVYFGIWSLADAAWGVEPFDIEVRLDGATAVLRASLPHEEQARREAIDDNVDLATAAGIS